MQDHIQTDYPTSAADSPQSPLYRSTSRPSISSSSATAAAAAAITKPYPVLGVKMSRPCNVVSFSPTHPHLLAAGLDKVRNDPCLLVWDISQAVEASSAGPQTPTTPYYRPSSARSTSGFSERDVFFSGTLWLSWLLSLFFRISTYTHCRQITIHKPICKPSRACGNFFIYQVNREMKEGICLY